MSERQPRSGGGEFGEKVTEQDILKVFDATEDAFLTAGEIADQLPISRQAVNYRLKQMQEKDLVEKKKAGARAAGWWANFAPAPSEETLRDIEATEGELERGETVGLAEMKRRIGMNE